MVDIAGGEKLWEKCARMLMLNPLQKLELFLQTVVQITDNISSSPGTLKFRTLKYSNASIKSKIVEVHGGVEFFIGIGFRNHTDADSGKNLHLDCPPGAENTIIDNLSAGKSWLINTLSTCASVTGGFMRGDKLDHVRSFACCHFVNGRADDVGLALPESSLEVSGSLLECTLEELGLFPRAVVFATVRSETQREELLSQKHQEQLYAQESRTASVKKEKKIKVDMRQALKEERARILGAFKDDRLN